MYLFLLNIRLTLNWILLKKIIYLTLINFRLMKKALPLVIVFSLALNSLFAQCTPPGDITISGDASGCTDRVAVYTISPSAGATDYVWKITGTSTKTKQTATKYSVVFEENDITIEVTPMNGNCAGTTVVKTIRVSETPIKPNISQNGNTLDAKVDAHAYKWYLDSELIPGATTKTYVPAKNGVYLVEAMNDKGCSAFSSPFNVYNTAVQEDAIFKAFSFYPNPITTKVFVDFSNKYELSFTNLMGQKVLERSDLLGKQEIDLSSLKRGMYLMRVSSMGKTAVRKLLLQ